MTVLQGNQMSDFARRVIRNTASDFDRSQPQFTLVFASSDGCVPCMFAMPIVRKLAIQANGAFQLMEVTSETSPAFIAEHAIDRFPQMLAFADGKLVDRMIGYESDAAITVFVERALQMRLPQDRQEREQFFGESMACAHSAFEAAMAPARAAIDPHMCAIETKLAELDTRLEADVAAGWLTPREAGRMRCTEQGCLFAPFKDKIAALSQAQAGAMATFEASALSHVRAYAAG